LRRCGQKIPPANPLSTIARILGRARLGIRRSMPRWHVGIWRRLIGRNRHACRSCQERRFWMDQRLVTALQSVGSMNRHAAATTLVSAFRAVGVGRHTVRVARDRFNAIVAQARNGTPRLIGAKPKTMTVGMSLTDLVEIVRVAAK